MKAHGAPLVVPFRRAWCRGILVLGLVLGVSPGFADTITLENPTPDSGDQFGSAVAALGEDVVVGAPGDSDDRGAAYIYSGVTGELVRTLQAPSQPLDAFGFAIAAVGNDELLISAPFANQNAGVIYLMNREGNLLKSYPNPHPLANPSYTDFFGGSLAAAGSRFVVGAPLVDTVDAFNQGSVVLFDRNGGDLPVRTFTNPDAPNGNNLGFSAAVVGDDVAGGAPFREMGPDGKDDPNVPGVVFVFDAATGAQLRRLEPPIPTLGDRFGLVLAGQGDRLFVAAPHAEKTKPNVGEVHLFDLSGPTDAPVRTYRSAVVPKQHDRFGRGIAILGDALAVSAETADLEGDDSGAVYVFDIESGEQLQTYKSSNPSAGQEFGISVAATAGGSLVVGALRADSGAADAGGAYLFVSRCGDGKRDPGGGEACDDGEQNGAGTSCCDGECRPRTAGLTCALGGQTGVCDGRGVCAGVCGNGRPDALGEECDDGNAKCGDDCDPNCTTPKCGNGFRCEVAGEECDDQNQTRGDGCANCFVECLDDAGCPAEASCTPRACLETAGSGKRCQNLSPLPGCIPCAADGDCAEDPADDPCTVDRCSSLLLGCVRQTLSGATGIRCALGTLATEECPSRVVVRVNKLVLKTSRLVDSAEGKCPTVRRVKPRLARARGRLDQARSLVVRLYALEKISEACSRALGVRLSAGFDKLSAVDPFAFCPPH